jgi:hypothetical protein
MVPAVAVVEVPLARRIQDWATADVIAEHRSTNDDNNQRPAVGVARPTAVQRRDFEERPETPNEEPSRPRAYRSDRGVRTSLGGVFFLVNVMAHLDLPAVFEDDWHLASRVGAWGTLDMLARGLLDAASGGSDDPVWITLAALRGGRTSFRRLSGRRPYRIPSAWLDLDRPDSGQLNWAAAARRMRVWSSLGYPVVDEPLRGASSRDVLARAAGTLGLDAVRIRPAVGSAGHHHPPGALMEALPVPARRWLGFVVPFVQRRLQLALGTPRRADAITGLLRRPGHLHVGDLHLDVVMRLDDVSLRARVAGLDRDPGWAPDFGRVIRFHFE